MYLQAQPEHSLKYTFEDYRSRRWFEQDRTFYVVAPQFEARLEVRYDPFGVGAAGSLAPVFGDRAGAAVEEELASSAREASDGSGTPESGDPESGGPESGDPFQHAAQERRAGEGGSEETASGKTQAADSRKQAQETFITTAITQANYPIQFDVEAFERTPVGLVARRIEREHNTAHRFGAAITMEEAIEQARVEEPQTKASVEQVQLPDSRPRVQ